MRNTFIQKILFKYYNDEDIIKYISKNNSNNIDKNTNFSKLKMDEICSKLHGTPILKEYLKK